MVNKNEMVFISNSDNVKRCDACPYNMGGYKDNIAYVSTGNKCCKWHCWVEVLAVRDKRIIK